MKSILAAVLALSLIIAPATSFAKKEKNGPQSTKAYEKANENASFKRGDDSKADNEAEDRSQKLQKQHKKQERKSENTGIVKGVKVEGDESKPKQVSSEEPSE